MAPVFHASAVTLTPGRAHGGQGTVAAARVAGRASDSARLFLDMAVLEPGATIGLHEHGDDEEIYVVVTGHGEVQVDGTACPVGPGDVIVNPPGGAHALANTGAQELRIVVVDVEGR